MFSTRTGCSVHTDRQTDRETAAAAAAADELAKYSPLLLLSSSLALHYIPPLIRKGRSISCCCCCSFSVVAPLLTGFLFPPLQILNSMLDSWLAYLNHKRIFLFNNDIFRAEGEKDPEKEREKEAKVSECPRPAAAAQQVRAWPLPSLRFPSESLFLDQ